MNHNFSAWLERLRHRVTSCLIFLAAASMASATMAQSRPIPPCLGTNPAPTSALLVYGGSARPATVSIEQITPNCIRLNYGGSALWTTVNEAGGVSCAGSTVQVDFNTAGLAFTGMRGKTPPAACGPSMPVPAGPPPAATGPTVNIYYGRSMDMASVPLVSATANCYQVNLSGNSAWFPSSALGYRTEFSGNPVGLDYKARRSTPCAIEPTPTPPPPAAKPAAPAPACLGTSPAPTSALITYGGSIKPVRVKIEQIMPKCIRLNYAGNVLWTTANEAGGVSCDGNMVQVDYGKANGVFNRERGTTPPAACN